MAKIAKPKPSKALEIRTVAELSGQEIVINEPTISSSPAVRE